jgi:hypothetical protein
MLYTDYDLAERLMDLHVQEEQHQAQLRRLEREARKGHPSWGSQQRGRLLCQLGSLLTSLGRRLLDAGLPRAPFFEEHVLPK